MTFEGQKFQGQQAIIQKLTNMPFQNVAVAKDTIDVQPSISGGILVFITGKLMVSLPARPSAQRGSFGDPRGLPVVHACAHALLAPPCPCRFGAACLA